MNGLEVTSAPQVNARRWLFGIIAASTVLRATFALTHGCPIIFDDEMIYADMAKGFAATGAFTVRDVPCPQHSLVYPFLISPAYALFESLPNAYVAIKILNALFMSLAAVPAYFLARRVLDVSQSLFVAGMSLAVPSMMYTALVMTENAFYPLALFFTLAAMRAIERPTIGRQAALIVLLGMTILTRTQGVALAGAAVTMYVGWAWSESRASGGTGFVRGLRAFWPTWLAGLLGAALLIGYAYQRGGVDALLGAYARQKMTLPPIGRLLDVIGNHIAALDLAAGVLPFAAFLILAVIGLFGNASRPVRILAVVSVSLFLWLSLFSATWIAIAGGHYRILERTIFHVSPLFFIALFWWIGRERRSWWIAAAAASVAAGLPALVTDGSIAHSFDSPILFFLQTLRSVGGDAWKEWTIALLAGAGVVSLALLALRRLGPLAPLTVMLYFIVVLVLVEERLTGISAGVRFFSVGDEIDWIDRAVPPDASVAMLWTPASRHIVVFVNEIFNRRVGTIYSNGARFPGWPAQTPVTLDSSGRYLGSDGEPVTAAYALAEKGKPLEGEILAQDPKTSLVLYRTNGTLRLAR